MSHESDREVEHEITTSAPAGEVYRLLAEVENWPRIFPPSVHVECLERDGGSERIRMWATTNGRVTTWTSHRELDPYARRIEFRQESSTAPVARMGGTWIVEECDDGSRVRLLHRYRAVDDDAAGLAWIEAAVDRNSASELAALKAAAEAPAGSSELFLSFTDSLRIDGAARDAYDFVDDAAAWAERLPHVDRVSLVEDTPGLQSLEMDTRAGDGSVHTTHSVRITSPPEKIVYKQTRPPALMTLHTGVWTFTEDAGGAVATSRHDVIIDGTNVTRILGPGAAIADARAYVRRVLGANSMATLRYARDHAERRAAHRPVGAPASPVDRT